MNQLLLIFEQLAHYIKINFPRETLILMKLQKKKGKQILLKFLTDVRNYKIHKRAIIHCQFAKKPEDVT